MPAGVDKKSGCLLIKLTLQSIDANRRERSKVYLFSEYPGDRFFTARMMPSKQANPPPALARTGTHYNRLDASIH